MNIKIKICCINSIEEARTAISFGATEIGLVGKMPSGPGPISDELIFKIAKSIPSTINTFLLTSEIMPVNILKHHELTRTNTIQFVDAISSSTFKQLRKLIPSVKFVQVIHVIGEKSVEEAIEKSEHVDFLLLDSGNPKLPIKELGGTGRVHNWKLSRQIRDNIKIPLFLAGGIKASNVKQAIEEVEPYGIDLCTGVRTNGNLDVKKLDQFFSAVVN